jgi:hypothetical protein
VNRRPETKLDSPAAPKNFMTALRLPARVTWTPFAFSPLVSAAMSEPAGTELGRVKEKVAQINCATGDERASSFVERTTLGRR